MKYCSLKIEFNSENTNNSRWYGGRCFPWKSAGAVAREGGIGCFHSTDWI